MAAIPRKTPKKRIVRKLPRKKAFGMNASFNILPRDAAIIGNPRNGEYVFYISFKKLMIFSRLSRSASFAPSGSFLKASRFL